MFNELFNSFMLDFLVIDVVVLTDSNSLADLDGFLTSFFQWVDLFKKFDKHNFSYCLILDVYLDMLFVT